MPVKFDQKTLAALKPDGSIHNFSDPQTPGLWFRMTAKGAKTYYLVYRMGGRGSKLKWLRLGAFADLPLVRAREYARAYRAQVDAGINPAEALTKKAASSFTVADAVERYLTEYAPSKLKPQTIKNFRSTLEKHVLPTLGKTSVEELSREIVKRWYASKPARPVIGRVLAILSSICTQCEVWGLRPDGSNPCRHIKRHQEAPRVRDISPSELKAIGLTIQQFENSHKHNVWALAAIKVIALTAGRVSEVLSLKYNNDLHLDEGYALLRDHKTAKKTGAKYLELPIKAVEIIKSLPVQNNTQWVFPGNSQGSPLSYDTVHRVWDRLC
ncbi:MAG: integrase arm-type DNA-binding domain-containing protein, partial [Holophagales bacterium]|nr:integrase arm-type DNA-binding domain-containing protein [Holophagales bacterium]